MPSTLHSEGWKEANSPVINYILNYLSLLKKKTRKTSQKCGNLFGQCRATCSCAAYPQTQKQVTLSLPSPKLLLGDGTEHNSCHHTRPDEVLK